jgi:hypothetical protein
MNLKPSLDLYHQPSDFACSSSTWDGKTTTQESEPLGMGGNTFKRAKKKILKNCKHSIQRVLWGKIGGHSYPLPHPPIFQGPRKKLPVSLLDLKKNCLWHKRKQRLPG